MGRNPFLNQVGSVGVDGGVSETRGIGSQSLLKSGRFGHLAHLACNMKAQTRGRNPFLNQVGSVVSDRTSGVMVSRESRNPFLNQVGSVPDGIL